MAMIQCKTISRGLITNLGLVFAETKWLARIILQVLLQVAADGINVGGNKEFAGIRIAVEFITNLKTNITIRNRALSNK